MNSDRWLRSSLILSTVLLTSCNYELSPWETDPD